METKICYEISRWLRRKPKDFYDGMTVKDLIRELKKCDPDRKVAVFTNANDHWDAVPPQKVWDMGSHYLIY